MKSDFDLSVETDNDTGRVIAVYFQVRKGKAATVREYANGQAFANYNSGGELLGVELLAPCNIRVLDKIANTASVSIRERTKRFLRSSVPREMVETAAAG